jgi:hypothetical protein
MAEWAPAAKKCPAEAGHFERLGIELNQMVPRREWRNHSSHNINP